MTDQTPAGLRSHFPPRTRLNLGVAIISALLLGTLALSGCIFHGSAGSLRTQSLSDDPVVLFGNFRNVYFSHSNESGTSFMLSNVPLDQLQTGKLDNAQILHVQLLWMPKAGSTPMEPSATNASIRYVVISGGQVGLYSGAGFAMPSDSLDSDKVTLTLRDASVQLQQSTPGFHDLLSPAQMTGTFTAKNDDKITQQMNRAASQIVTNALGKTTLVMK
jgi:hypothetical protein